MASVELEHVNVTVSDPEKTANLMCRLFDWKVRWCGETPMGLTYHVGTDSSYIALYRGNTAKSKAEDSYATIAGLNHIAVVVDDLDLIEHRVLNEGFKPHTHADYEPGKRFYFNGYDDIEYEVVTYKS